MLRREFLKLVGAAVLTPSLLKGGEEDVFDEQKLIEILDNPPFNEEIIAYCYSDLDIRLYDSAYCGNGIREADENMMIDGMLWFAQGAYDENPIRLIRVVCRDLGEVVLHDGINEEYIVLRTSITLFGRRGMPMSDKRAIFHENRKGKLTIYTY